MSDTLDALSHAEVTDQGTYVTVLFHQPDRQSTQFKQMVSFQMGKPVQFIWNHRDGTRIQWVDQGGTFNPHGPAIVDESPQRYEETHNLQSGQLGRKGGPAYIQHAFGVSYVERWTPGGNMLHRVEGPALVEIDYGDPNKMSWERFTKELDIKSKMNTRQEGTVIKRREKTWYRHGKCTNEDTWAKQSDFTVFEWFEVMPPMSIMRTTFVAQRELRWYDEEERIHRLDGPAILKMTNVIEIEKDGTKTAWQCEKWSGEWYVRGTLIPSLTILQWAKKHGVPMHNEACYDKSAFKGSDGELCFITDIAQEHMA